MVSFLNNANTLWRIFRPSQRPWRRRRWRGVCTTQPPVGRDWPLPRILVAGILVLWVAGSSRALAQPAAESGPPLVGAPLPPPSPFETGMRGFGMGVTVGLAGGYLVARNDGWNRDDWRPLVAGAGIGALAGGVLGLTLGLVDSNTVPPRRPTGRTYLVMRGMSEGGGFGLVAGGIIGGLVALKTDQPEHILLGAAIGILSGTVLGLVYGALQPDPWAAQPATRPERLDRHVGIMPCSTLHGGLAWGPALSGQF